KWYAFLQAFTITDSRQKNHRKHNVANIKIYLLVFLDIAFWTTKILGNGINVVCLLTEQGRSRDKFIIKDILNDKHQYDMQNPWQNITLIEEAAAVNITKIKVGCIAMLGTIPMSLETIRFLRIITSNDREQHSKEPVNVDTSSTKEMELYYKKNHKMAAREGTTKG
ncbi:hypothetical protein ACJX0J_023472, partial [Zea mays]